VITDEGVRVVKDEYKYKSGSYTPIDNFFKWASLGTSFETDS